MNDKTLSEMCYDALIPHAARISRKLNGSPEGNLICQCCGATNASKNRQRSRYSDSDNMETLCPTCQDDRDAYFDELWDEYYYGR